MRAFFADELRREFARHNIEADDDQIGSLVDGVFGAAYSELEPFDLGRQEWLDLLRIIASYATSPPSAEELAQRRESALEMWRGWTGSPRRAQRLLERIDRMVQSDPDLSGLKKFFSQPIFGGGGRFPDWKQHPAVARFVHARLPEWELRAERRAAAAGPEPPRAA
jgi:hypothetical protein